MEGVGISSGVVGGGGSVGGSKRGSMDGSAGSSSGSSLGGVGGVDILEASLRAAAAVRSTDSETECDINTLNLTHWQLQMIYHTLSQPSLLNPMLLAKAKLTHLAITPYLVYRYYASQLWGKMGKTHQRYHTLYTPFPIPTTFSTNHLLSYPMTCVTSEPTRLHPLLHSLSFLLTHLRSYSNPSLFLSHSHLPPTLLPLRQKVCRTRLRCSHCR